MSRNQPRKRLIGIILSLSFIITVACSGVSQKAEPQKPEAPKIIIEGKLDYWKNLNEYVVIGPRTYFIANQNRKLLEDLFKSQKTITIEGHRTTRADFLFIEKIGNQPYTGNP